MSANDEMQVYLEELLAHERNCDVENCGLCQSAQNVYRLVRNLVFAEVLYPDMTIARRGGVHGSPDPQPPAAARSVRRAA